MVGALLLLPNLLYLGSRLTLLTVYHTSTQIPAYPDIFYFSISRQIKDYLHIENRCRAICGCPHGSVISQASMYNWHWAEFLPDDREIICVSAYGLTYSINSWTRQITQHPN